MQKVSRSFCIAVLGLLLSGTLLAETPKEATPESNFLTVADIHFDPFIGCQKSPQPCPLLNSLRKSPYQAWDMIFEKSGDQSMSGTYEDTDYVLLKSALQQLQLVDQKKHPDFVLVLGDFLAHRFDYKFMHYSKDHSRAAYRAFIKKTMEYLTYKIRKTFPDIDVYPVIGNNDSYTGDYSVIPNGQFLKDTGNLWETLILNPKNKASFQTSFMKAGYYVVTIPHQPQHKVIVLNSVLFSVNAKSNQQKIAAEKQLVWLHHELMIAKDQHQKVLIAFHIPVDLEMIAGIKTHFGAAQFWQFSYIHAFETEIKEFAPEIIAMLPAHIHIEIKRRIISKEFGEVPVDFTPSISPIFGNDPGFKIFTYDATTFEIETIQTYYFTLRRSTPDWHKEYGMTKPYMHPAVDKNFY